ncbi:MAG: MOSC domain-containing protein [Candidatus Dormibacteria bacterium]
MYAAELWRYPVKSMAGERLSSIEVMEDGLSGDRRVAVFDRQSSRPQHPLSARQDPQLLNFRAVWAPDGPLVAGPGLAATRWDRSTVREVVSRLCGRDLELAEVPHGAFDDAAVHVLGLASVRQLARELGRPVDHRRFRANVYLEGLEPDSEPAWAGHQFGLGGATLTVAAGCPRCAITTRDPDTLEVWPRLLRHVIQTRSEVMGVFCAVASPGRVAEGAPFSRR